LGKVIIVIPKSSIVIPEQIDTESIVIIDHYINMVKFVTQSNEFKRVAGHLKLIVEEVPTKVQKNWLTERSMKAGK
jgi:hypothetical protein